MATLGLEDKQRRELEVKMKEMWKVIDDLKNKVMEERELLKKEKIENEKLVEEQNKLRKQLSMFHLPHCPAYNTLPCPVHHPQTHSLAVPGAEASLEQYRAELNETLMQGSQELKTYEEFLKQLYPNVKVSHEDLFHDCTPRPVLEEPAKNFTEVLSNNWCHRQIYSAAMSIPQDSAYTGTPNELTKQTEAGDGGACQHAQVTSPEFIFKFGESQITAPPKRF